MTKVLAWLMIVAMILHVVKPLGLPGLKRRGDFWKLALLALGIWAVALLLRDVVFAS